MDIKDKACKTNLPIKVVQFGEGNFLRAFVDYMIDIANEKEVFGGSVAIVKPIAAGSLDFFREQDNLYTVVLRGMENGKVVDSSRIITSVSKTLDCCEDFDSVMALAELETLRFVVSNTTEAGIVLNEKDNFEGVPSTFPGKLTKFLYHRYETFGARESAGLIILPVELIENNGGKLKECVLALANIWGLPNDFKDWLTEHNVFCSTLVDRIVTGYPKAEADNICEKLGYTDKLLDVGEPFALWVIESEQDISGDLPFDKIGLPVVFTNNQKPYRERKVRVLNGAHTSSVLIGYLYGLDIVRDCMNDEIMGNFIRNIVREEIVPEVKLPIDEVNAFADSVFERFENPFIDHSLLAISLNSISKWKARVLPSFKDYIAKNNKLPRLMTFSFAALLSFYTSNNLTKEGLVCKRNDGTEYFVNDDSDVLEFFAENANASDFVEKVCKNETFWGEDLSLYNGFVDEVKCWYDKIRANPKAALLEVLDR